MTSLAKEFIRKVRQVTGPGPVGLHEPTLGEIEKKILSECIDSGYVSSAGPWVSEFEKRICEVTGARFAIATSSGTTALQIALITAGVIPGDEVLIPALTFVATANAVVHAGAVPHFVDVETRHAGIDPISLRKHLESFPRNEDGHLLNTQTGNPISSLVPMHCFGFPARVNELLEIAREFHLVVIEDAAEGLGSFSGNRHVGRFGQAGVISFNGNKIITTGGGGVIITDDDGIAKAARHISTTAKVPHAWKFEHDEIGFNYRLPSLNAALGVAQLSRLEGFLAQKKSLATRYVDAFEGLPGVKIMVDSPGNLSNHWLISAILESPMVELRDEILGLAYEEGLSIRPAWDLVSSLKPYKRHPRANLDVAEDFQNQILSLPSSPFLIANS